jgi:hypothetical protein
MNYYFMKRRMIEGVALFCVIWGSALSVQGKEAMQLDDVVVTATKYETAAKDIPAARSLRGAIDAVLLIPLLPLLVILSAYLGPSPLKVVFVIG